MKSSATTVAAYLESLPPDRRNAIVSVRRVILENLRHHAAESKGKNVLEERMQYGVIAYCVPRHLWPYGHHTRPELPLMYMGLSSQKNDMVVYMLCLFENEPMRDWFSDAWKATGKKLHIEVGGMGCCVRFKKLEDLSLAVIGEAIRRVPLRAYLENHVAMLARRGKGPDGKPLKRGATATTKEKEVSRPTREPPQHPKTAKPGAKPKPNPKPNAEQTTRKPPKRKAAAKRG
ncbi:MAG: DUF1801 domain-containing protein [Phycisphaerales bacterium]